MLCATSGFILHAPQQFPGSTLRRVSRKLLWRERDETETKTVISVAGLAARGVKFYQFLDKTIQCVWYVNVTVFKTVQLFNGFLCWTKWQPSSMAWEKRVFFFSIQTWALLATGGLPSQKDSNANLWYFFVVSLNTLLNKHLIVR